MSDAITTGIAVALLLLCALHWRLTGMPARLWGLARNELTKGRATDDAQAQKALTEATTAKAAALLTAVRQYQEQIAADFRKQIADAELRARVADRNAADTATALETATALVRELRTTLDGLGELPALVREARRRRRGSAAAPPEDAGPAELDDNRKTVEMTPPASCAPPPSTTATATDDDQGWDDPEERTKVFAADKPGTAPAPSLHLPERPPPPVPRVALRPPPLADEVAPRAAEPEDRR